MRRTYRTLNDCEMQHNAEVGLFTKPSNLRKTGCRVSLLGRFPSWVYLLLPANRQTSQTYLNAVILNGAETCPT